MSDLIKREDAIKALYKYSFVSKDVIEKEINAIPSADRPQGEWIYTNNPLRLDDEWECSKCGYLSFTKANYCEHCGCRMKGANDDG